MAKQQIKYKTVAATDINSFDDAVNLAIADGYDMLAGTLNVTPHQDKDGYGMQYTIAMVKVTNVEG